MVEKLAAGGSFDLGIGDHVLRVRTIASADPRSASRATLVILHDSLGCITVWRDFPDQLAERLGCTALVYDRRGYGGSSPFSAEARDPSYLHKQAEVLESVLIEAGIDRAVLFGHSDGGSIALIAAARHPERIRAVVTEGAHVFVEPESLAGIREAKLLLQTTDLRERLVRHHGDKTDGVTSAWIDTWLHESFHDWNIEALLSAIHCPLLVLQGVDDEYGTVAQVDAIASQVSGPVETHVIPGAAHTPHREARDATLELTVRFLSPLLEDNQNSVA